MSNKPMCHNSKKRSESESKSLINRLKRIEGQVRGVIGMVESDIYCVEILTQVAAIKSALTAFSQQLLRNHIKDCVVTDIKKGRLDAVDELCEVLGRLLKK